MAHTPIRWGILGAAKIAREWLCPAINASAHGQIAAVASRSLAKAQAMAAPYVGAKAYDSYDALLADPDIDAIYIPLPNTEHVEWTLKCLNAGKHVLCEKPIAMKAAEIDALIALRNKTGLLAAEAFMVTHHPQWHRVRALIGAGKIGRLRHVQGAFSFFNDDMGNIRNQKAYGGGALPDIGVYPAVTTRFVTGEEPVAMRAQIEWENGVDITARAQADFPGFTMDFYVSIRMALRQQMVFHGEKAVLTLNAPFNAGSYGQAEIDIRHPDGSHEIEVFQTADQYRNQFDAFHDTLLNGTRFSCPLEFSKGNQRMIDMVYAAAEPQK